MDKNNTTIGFVNVRNDEVFSFSLVLVRGYIEDPSSKESQILVVYNVVDSSNKQEVTKTKIENNKFTVLLELQSGRNEFMFETESIQSMCRRTFFLNSSVSKKVVTPVFVLCRSTNESNLALLCKRITLGCKIIQTLIAETLFQCGFRKKTFTLDKNGDDKDNSCVVFNSNLDPEKIATMTNEDLWEHLGREIMTSKYGCKDRKYLAFLTRSTDGYSENIAIGGGGLALCDSKYLKMWPDSINNINENFLTNSTDRIDSWMKNGYGAAFGAVCHELCHTFDLGHTVLGIMGREYDQIGYLLSPVRPINSPDKFSRGFLSCTRKLNDSLIVNEGVSKRKLDIHYSVSEDNALATMNIVCKRNDLNKLFPTVVHWFGGCATLLAYHKWFNNELILDTIDDDILHYDQLRSIVTSKYGIIVVQLCKSDGYIFKYWEFASSKKRKLFLVPIYEVRRACHIIIEDLLGNIVRKDIKSII